MRDAENMKILHCIPHLSGGGAQRQLSYLASELVKRDHEVHIAYLTTGPSPEDYRDSRIVLHRLSPRSNYDPRLFAELSALMNEIRPQVVQTWLLQMDVIAGGVALRKGIPWVLREPTSNAFWTAETGVSGLKARLRAFLGRRARAVVSNSDGGDEFWRPRRPGRACFVISNALPLAEIAQAEPFAGNCTGVQDRDVVLYAGRFDERQKNISNMMSGLIDIARRLPLSVVLCGDGEDRSSAERQVTEAGLSGRFLFMGHSTEVWSWMKKAKAFVCVGEFEGQPNTVMEAMACGCPLVLSDIPGHRALLDDTMCFYVDAANPKSIADGIAAVLNEPAIARSRAAKAAEHAQMYSLARMASAYERVYAECAGA